MLRNAVGALVMVMSVPRLAAVILTLVEYRSFRALIAAFSKKITLKSILFTFVSSVHYLFCFVLALITKQGTLFQQLGVRNYESAYVDYIICSHGFLLCMACFML